MRCTSPRITQLLHQARNLACFAHVALILHQTPCLGCEPATSTLTVSRLSYRLPGSLSTAQAAPPRDFIQRTQPVTAKTQ
jgi:hypothetical protein